MNSAVLEKGLDCLVTSQTNVYFVLKLKIDTNVCNQCEYYRGLAGVHEREEARAAFLMLAPSADKKSAAMYLLHRAVRGTKRNVPLILWSIQPNDGRCRRE